MSVKEVLRDEFYLTVDLGYSFKMSFKQTLLKNIRYSLDSRSSNGNVALALQID